MYRCAWFELFDTEDEDVLALKSILEKIGIDCTIKEKELPGYSLGVMRSLSCSWDDEIVQRKLKRVMR